MDSFEFNKIAAAILVVALLLIGLNQIADSIYHVKKPETPGYKIEGVAETKTEAKGEAKKEEKLADIKVLLATANVAAGENTFKKCAACHTNVSGGAAKIDRKSTRLNSSH